MLDYALSKLPLASSLFLVYALTGGAMFVAGTLGYGSYATNLLAVGLACGAIGVPRAISKVGQGLVSTNFLGFIESIPIPTVVFVVFTGVSTVALIETTITFAAFSENLTKVGIACGAVQAARAIEAVAGLFVSAKREELTPVPPPSPKPEAPPPPAPSA